MSEITNGTTTSAVSNHITVIDGKPTTTTQDIADVYGKDHGKVLRIVRQRMTEAGEWGVANFGDTPYTNPQNGQTYPVIRMTKKGFHFVVGKFTGSKAVQHQIAFADEFERMEATLNAKPAEPRIPFSVNPGDTLSAAQAEQLRLILKEKCDTLPKEEQAGFMTKGWSKLKSHFGVTYRKIEQREFSEAISMATRHAAEWTATPQLPAPAPVERPTMEDKQMSLDVQTLCSMITGGLMDNQALLKIGDAAGMMMYRVACQHEAGWGKAVAKQIDQTTSTQDLQDILKAASLETWFRARGSYTPIPAAPQRSEFRTIATA